MTYEERTDALGMVEMTVQCHVCGYPLTVKLPAAALKAFPAGFWDGLAKMTVHEECAQQERYWRQMVAEDVKVTRAAQRWEMLAPPLYQGTEAWLANGGQVSRPAFDRALDWTGPKTGLLLYGNRSGTGKTSAAWLVLRRLMADGSTAAAYSHADFTRRATQMARDGDAASYKWVQLLVKNRVLLIDDLGQAKFKTADGMSKQAEELLFDILRARIDQKRPTIITTNDTTESLRAKLSADRAEPLVRRLQEHFDHVHFA